MSALMEPSRPIHEAIVDNDTDTFEDWILATALHSHVFFHQVASVLCRNHQTGEFEDDFRLPVSNGIWQILVDYHGQIPGLKKPVISAGLARALLLRLAHEPRIIALSDVGSAAEKVAHLLTVDIRQLEPMVRKGFEYWIMKVRIGRTVNRVLLHDSWTPIQFQESIAAQLKGLTTVTTAEQFFSFGHGIDNEVLDVRRISTGFQRLDLTLGGGLGESECTLFIAAQGVGKTVAACQIGSTMAIDGHPGVIVTTEQKHDQLEPRIVSCHCPSIGFADVKDKVRPDAFTAKQRAEYDNVRRQLDKRLYIYNWSDDREKSVQADLETLLQGWQDRFEGEIRWIMFDWIGGALGEGITDPSKLRLIYQTSADTLVKLAEKYNMTIGVFAQAHPVLGINKHRVDASVMAECKSMGRNMTAIVGISGMLEKVDETVVDQQIFCDRQWLYVSKSRKGVTKMLPIRRNFARQRFDDIF